MDMSDKKFWGDKPYFSLDHYLKQTFGEKVYRLSLNGGMTCPNRDGTLDSRGCIFCSAGGSGDFATAPSLSVTEQITQAKERIRRKSNALKVVESIPADQPIIFAPDRNLGSYIQKLTGRENMVIWDGACHVHEEFSLEKILELKRQHPAAQVVVHPECRAYIVQVADFVGSTAAILDYCGKSSAREFIVVTEAGILTEMKRRYPEKTFIPAPPDDEACGCNNCRYMKMITLENIFTTLRDERPEISLDEEVRRRAERSILNMIAIK